MGDALLRAAVPVERQHVEGRVLGDLVSTDLLDWSGGDADIMPEGYRYLLVAVDMSPSRYMSAQLVAGRESETILGALDRIMEGYREAGHTMRAVRADGEFGSGTRLRVQAIFAGLQKRGIQVEHCAPYEHTQNGVVERHIQTVEGHLRAIMHARHKDCPYIWGRALQHFVMMWNATSPVSVGVSAYTEFTGRTWDLKAYPLLPWGAEVEALEEPTPTNNSHPRTFTGFYMGVSLNHSRCILVLRKGADVTAQLLIRRSYWAVGVPPLVQASEGEAVDVELTARSNLEEVGRWFGMARGSDGVVPAEGREQGGMWSEDVRGRAVLKDIKNEQWQWI